MADRRAIEKGFAYEKEFAESVGGELTLGSGNTPLVKLDVGGAEVVWECKHTTDESYRLTAKTLRKMLEGASGPGSRGKIGAMAIRIEGIGADITAMRTEDLLGLLRGDIKLDLPSNKLKTKRAGAEPAFLRGDDG